MGNTAEVGAAPDAAVGSHMDCLDSSFGQAISNGEIRERFAIEGRNTFGRADPQGSVSGAGKGADVRAHHSVSLLRIEMPQAQQTGFVAGGSREHAGTDFF